MWSKSVFEINNLIRGVTRPYPGAFAMYDSKKNMIWKSQVWDTVLDFYVDKKYGEVVEVFENDFVVKCYDGLLLVTDHEDDSIFVGKVYV